MSEAELAYFAGFFDGEGCVSIARQRRGTRPHFVRLLVVNTNREVLDWIRQRFGGDISAPTMGAHVTWKQRHMWRLSGTAVEPLLRAMLPYLRVKRPQAELALLLRATKRYVPAIKKDGRRVGRQLTEESLLAAEEISNKMHELNRKGQEVPLARAS